MTVKELIDLLDTCNPSYTVHLDIDFDLGDSYTSDPATKTIYLETTCPSLPKSQTLPLYA